MTVDELLTRMSSAELTDRLALARLRHREFEHARARRGN